MKIANGWKRTSAAAAAVLGAGLIVSGLAARGIGGGDATPVIDATASKEYAALRWARQTGWYTPKSTAR